MACLRESGDERKCQHRKSEQVHREGMQIQMRQRRHKIMEERKLGRDKGRAHGGHISFRFEGELRPDGAHSGATQRECERQLQKRIKRELPRPVGP